jgi:hypothetical protein
VNTSSLLSRRKRTPRSVGAAGATRVRLSATQPASADAVVSAIGQGLMPYAVERLNGTMQIQYAPEPEAPNPHFTIIEEYCVASYLGDYGAGKTVGTFSLLPGERTTLSLRTYEDREETVTQAESILDSFTEESADEFEGTLQEEFGETADSSTNVSATTGGGVHAGLDLGIVSFGGEASGEVTVDTGTARHSYADTISTAVDKHVNKTSSHREVEINTTTTETVTSGMEQTTTREIENTNYSRVLNFVFRQLQQEYVTLTYLKNAKFAYSNGYPETLEYVDIPQLEALVRRVIKPAHVKDALSRLLKSYCSVYNHADERFAFVERVEESFGDCAFAEPGETTTFWRRVRGLVDRYDWIEVPGPILSLTVNVLPTASVIVEALLGQGEALDDYNKALQSALVLKNDLENRKTAAALGILDAIDDPVERANAYATMFGPPAAEEGEEEEE